MLPLASVLLTIVAVVWCFRPVVDCCCLFVHWSTPLIKQFYWPLLDCCCVSCSRLAIIRRFPLVVVCCCLWQPFVAVIGCCLAIDWRCFRPSNWRFRTVVRCLPFDPCDWMTEWLIDASQWLSIVVSLFSASVNVVIDKLRFKVSYIGYEPTGCQQRISYLITKYNKIFSQQIGKE